MTLGGFFDAERCGHTKNMHGIKKQLAEIIISHVFTVFPEKQSENSDFKKDMIDIFDVNA